MNWQSDSIKMEICAIVIAIFEKMDETKRKHDAGQMNDAGYRSVMGRHKQRLQKKLVEFRQKCLAKPSTGLMRSGVPVMPPEADEGEQC